MTTQLEYWLSLLKVITIIVCLSFYWLGAHTYMLDQIFIVLGIAVNCGANSNNHYIGSENWRIPGAPFVGGIGGFASVFVTAAFACRLTSVSV